MTIENVEERVKEIARVRGDDEHAHSLENKLHQDVLEFIANVNRSEFAGELARAALKTQDIDFERWCA